MIRLPPIVLLLLFLSTSAPLTPPPVATPACPRIVSPGPASLLTMLYAAGFTCTEEIAQALAPFADDWLLQRLLTLTSEDRHSLTRRNALRVIGRFGEQPYTSAARAALDRAAPALRERLITLLRNDPSDDVRAEAIWILDTLFFPAHDAQPALAAVAFNPAGSANLRARATHAIARLIAVRPEPLAATDIDLLLEALRSDEAGVRARAADAIQRMRDEQLDPVARARVISTLEQAWLEAADLAPAGALPESPPALHTARFILGIPETAPGPFAARAALARALDRFGGSRYHALRTEFETIHLPELLEQPGLRIHAAQPAADLAAIASQLVTIQTAFFTISGIMTPLASDPNPTLTIKLFDNRSVFREYMLAFIGFGADVDGIYVEADATLYTYQRDAAESANATSETIAHEYGHYLTGRYTFPGDWNDPGYHDQPKGWLDEGVAEYLAALVAPPDAPSQALQRLCAKSVPPSLAQLLALRDGYDQHGIFAYDEAWALVTFLAEERPQALPAIMAAFRDGSYQPDRVAELSAAPTLAQLEADWHMALNRWCVEGS